MALNMTTVAKTLKAFAQDGRNNARAYDETKHVAVALALNLETEEQAIRFLVRAGFVAETANLQRAWAMTHKEGR